MLTRNRLLLAGSLVGILVLGAVLAASLTGGDAGPTARPEASPAAQGAVAGVAEFDGEVPAALEDASTQYGADRGAVAPGDGAPPDDQFQALLDRKIVQSTSVDLGVEEVGRAFQEIIRVAETNGGFVASSSFSNLNESQTADLTVRVPSNRYQDMLAQVRGMGEVKQEASDSSDVTEEYTDLQARLRTFEATERRYLALLAEAETIEEILIVQDRLDGVRAQIEQVQGRINLLDHLTDLATITVHLRPLAAATVDGGGTSPLDAAERAWEASLEALRGLAAGALIVGAFSWWLVPPFAALAVGARWWLGRRPATGSSTASG
jgi:hypothetical protein